jgi:hypothetical protein
VLSDLWDRISDLCGDAFDWVHDRFDDLISGICSLGEWLGDRLGDAASVARRSAGSGPLERVFVKVVDTVGTRNLVIGGAVLSVGWLIYAVASSPSTEAAQKYTEQQALAKRKFITQDHDGPMPEVPGPILVLDPIEIPPGGDDPDDDDEIVVEEEEEEEEAVVEEEEEEAVVEEEEEEAVVEEEEEDEEDTGIEEEDEAVVEEEEEEEEVVVPRRPSRITQVSYQWYDRNQGGRCDSKEDQDHYQTSCRPLKIDLDLDLNAVDQEISAFGLPRSWQRYSYRSADELRKKEQRLTERAASVGFINTNQPPPGTLEIDYAWMVEQSISDTRPVVEEILEYAKNQGRNDLYELIELLTSFVQDGVFYQIPEMNRTGPSGETILIGGVQMPMETLSLGWGDCDTKSVLLASMLANAGNVGTIMVVGNGHAFLGFRGIPRRGQRYVEVNGVNYILVETTTPWRIGDIPEDSWLALNRNQLKIVPIR